MMIRLIPFAETAIIIASESAVGPSYIDALDTSIPVSWVIMDCHSKIYCRVPWATSG